MAKKKKKNHQRPSIIEPIKKITSVPLGYNRGYSKKNKVCPHCGETIEIEPYYWCYDVFPDRGRLHTVWTDTRHGGYGDLLEDWNNAVVRCPCCGKYFFLEDAQDSLVETTENKFQIEPLVSWWWAGPLYFCRGYYNELREAMVQFSETEPESRLFCLRRAAAILYRVARDLYASHNKSLFRVLFGKKHLPDEDEEFFRRNEEILLESDDSFPARVILKADILRQKGRFDECLDYIAGQEERMNSAGCLKIGKSEEILEFMFGTSDGITENYSCEYVEDESTRYSELLNRIRKLAEEKRTDAEKVEIGIGYYIK